MAGFTLVELMIVVAIIGLLASLAFPAFKRYTRRSRTVEAALQLNRMWAGAVAYYGADHVEQTFTGPLALPRRFPGPASEPLAGGAVDCCGSEGEKCPGGDPAFDQPVWTSLSFNLSDPYAYMPSFTSTDEGPDATFVAQSVGNLDCDGDRSSFVRRGGISPVTGDVYGGAMPEVTNELE